MLHLEAMVQTGMEHTLSILLTEDTLKAFLPLQNTQVLAKPTSEF